MAEENEQQRKLALAEILHALHDYMTGEETVFESGMLVIKEIYLCKGEMIFSCGDTQFRFIRKDDPAESMFEMIGTI